MKGDPRFAAKCPLCSHVVRPRHKRLENRRYGNRTASSALRTAMGEHLRLRHPGLSQREASLILDQLSAATATMQTQLEGGTAGPTALLQCPVVEDGKRCSTILQTFLQDQRGQSLSPHGVARHATRQHIYHKHPRLTPREVLAYLDQAEFMPRETGTEPSRPPQGRSASGPTLPNLVAPARPAEPAHASGKVEEARVLQANKRSETVVARATTV